MDVNDREKARMRGLRGTRMFTRGLISARLRARVPGATHFDRSLFLMLEICRAIEQ